MRKLWMFGLVLALASCAYKEKTNRNGHEMVSSSGSMSQKEKLEIIQKQLNRQTQIVEDLKKENERLRMANLKSLVKEQTSSAQGGQSFSQDLQGSIGETKIFGSFMNAFNSKRYQKADRAFQLMQKAYPQSSYLAEARYLRGKKLLEEKRSKAALREFERLIQDFPTHSRVRGAMLAKAVIYRRLNLIQPSKTVLTQIIARYPKSEEAQKASSHLKLIELAENRSVQ